MFFDKQATLYNGKATIVTSLFTCFVKYMLHNLIVSFVNYAA